MSRTPSLVKTWGQGRRRTASASASDEAERYPGLPVARIRRVHEPVGLAHPPGSGRVPRAAWWLAAAALVLAGAVVRVLGARGDLWLDEIWSMELARVAGSAVGVFTRSTTTTTTT